MKFTVIQDGNVFRWRRDDGKQPRVSREAWLSDVEAAESALRVASCYPDSVLSLAETLIDALNVWLTANQYAATVEVKPLS